MESKEKESPVDFGLKRPKFKAIITFSDFLKTFLTCQTFGLTERYIMPDRVIFLSDKFLFCVEHLEF